MDKTMLITDIGSTTTKAILIACENGVWQLKGLANAPTTVEKPQEDVMVGVLNAVRRLQTETGVSLLQGSLAGGSELIDPKLPWLSTSSAGGGLQILVIGLVKEESAASASRAAYGVGGVLLDTIAIDDGRTVIQQMHAIEEKQPDIILMSGGYEGGAYASVLRQAEILSYCEIRPKYALKDKIPLIFAGNADAAPAVKNILQESFEVHVLQNIRPREEVERVEHVTELVHELFLNKVMQQAPGYRAVSGAVADSVIPTPLGVMTALKIFAEAESKNILAVDIGGATTDVYSNVFGKFYRTVSANFGMSYNLCNVFAKADRAQLGQWLHPSLKEADLRNYIGNKMLYPTTVPATDTALHIEQALARIALQLSLQQHLQMNFSISRIGHFLRLKNDELDPFHEQFYREKLNERAEFRLQDFGLIIGAGGVVSHAPDPRQAALMLTDGLQPRGLTELWRDRHFISPHLGKLSQVDREAALALLKSECLEPLCLCVRPLPHRLRAGKPALRLELASEQENRVIEVDGNQLLWIANDKPLLVKAKAHGSIQLAQDRKELEIRTSLPIMVDTRIAGQFSFADMNAALQLYNNIGSEEADAPLMPTSVSIMPMTSGRERRTFALPYAGKIHVSEGEAVKPDTLLGENLYDPPRIFVLQVFRGREDRFDQDTFRKCLQVKAGDEIQSGQLIYKQESSFLESLLHSSASNFHSPVRGRLEKIDWQNGTLLLREIQDYNFEPQVVRVAEKLGVKPSSFKGYLKKSKGDFVTRGELLAVKDWKKFDQVVRVPTTGNITEVDGKKGTVTIQYLRRNLKLSSRLDARVVSIAKNRFLELEYEGTSLTGCIGFGKTADGTLAWMDSFTEASLTAGSLAAFPFALNSEQLQIAMRNKLAGVIVPSLQEEDVVRLLDYELGVGITGDEELPFSLILMHGFGSLNLAPETAWALQQNSGRHAVLFPRTQIRAGVVRPSLVIQ